jgi:iron complex outermembrane recepter protein
MENIQIKRKHLAIAVINAVAIMSLSGAAYAQSTDAQKVERVEITGSNIKRSIADESALPITILNAKELRESGVTSAEGVVQRIASSQSTLGSGQVIGSGTQGKANANVRGLGANKTLVLLNGRRIASFAFDSAAVDLNAIPFAAIDRIEVLRDGASAIYGTDAIGGVINFITRNDYQGGSVSAEYSSPQHTGGTDKRATVSGGFGDLNKDKFNVFAVLDWRQADNIRAVDRAFAATGVIPSRGVFLTSGTSFPANFTQNAGAFSGNPSRAAGCKPDGGSLPLAATTCRFDYTSAIDIQPDVEQLSFMTRGAINLGGGHKASLEYYRAQTETIARVAPDPVTGLVMTPSSPFFPRTYAGIDTTRNITVGWRMVPAGQRESTSNTVGQRLVADLSGVVSGWDYRGGLYWTQSSGDDAVTNGYVNKAAIQAGITSGVLNPFGEQTAAGLAAIDAAKAKGTSQTAKGSTQGVDLRASREMFALAGGAAAISVGGEYRKENYRNDTVDAIVLSVPSLGRDAYHVTGDRNVAALSAEMILPVSKALEIQVAARYDRYSDFGSTFNPKIGFLFKPVSNVFARGSYNTGFRAPALDELYGPQSVSFTADAYNDPLLCPGGKPAAGGVATRDCGQQAQIQTGGNRALKPEKSKTFTLGMGFEPMKGVVLTADYWNIKLSNQILPFPEQAVFDDPVRYTARILRCRQLSAAAQATLDRCQNEFANSNAIGYVIGLTDNLGGVRTDGVDLSAAYAFGAGTAGNFNLSLNSTWVNKYEFQRTPTDAYVSKVGRYVDDAPVFRWQHVLGLGWNRGAFSGQLNIRHKTGYTDQNQVDPGFENEVKAYTLVDLSGTWTGMKNLAVTLGVKNLFDTKPPFTNQGTVFQKGYDPRFTDAIGRAYMVRAAYSFK